MPRAVSRDAIYRRRRFSPDQIKLCVGWRITYRLGYRDLVAMLAERWRSVIVRDRRYINNIVEQDHRAIKRRCAPMLGFISVINVSW